ncbi:MAG TPA: patatin-like phospholipase family protein [Roseiarcus sp.]
MSFTNYLTGWLRGQRVSGQLNLSYFEDVLPVELKAVNERRDRLRERQSVRPLAPPPAAAKSEEREPSQSRKRSPDPDIVFPGGSSPPGGGPSQGPQRPIPANPDHDKTRPRPIPCDATGLAFSGGGIRSAAVCLGALQALNHNNFLKPLDYLSTVSGGGYIGACLSAAMTTEGGGQFPFGDDVSDSKAVAHLRNYSNYLLPRGRSGIRNVSEVMAVVLRGVLANVILVLATLIFCALVTKIAYPDANSLHSGSFAPRLLDGLLRPFVPFQLNNLIGPSAFSLSLWFAAAVAIILAIWAVLRSFPDLDHYTGDTKSLLLAIARVLIVGAVIVAFLDLQPLAIGLLKPLDGKAWAAQLPRWINVLLGVLAAFSSTISLVSSPLSRFLKTTQHSRDSKTFVLRGMTHFAIFLAAIVLPLFVWFAYLYLSAWIVSDPIVAPQRGLGGALSPILELYPWAQSSVFKLYSYTFLVLALIVLALRANGYSLHRLYRDRLSKAFLFGQTPQGSAEPKSLDDTKLSQLQSSKGPYHIINTAMNVQGSVEANRRGRNAEFFMFTRDFVGSDLTKFAPTGETSAQARCMEKIDRRLDLATAMAISGAAISANMGANTVRLLSPTLALLNIRLGYWLRNPLDIARSSGVDAKIWGLTGLLGEKFYILLEMLNQLDENSRNVYLSDGGHIENLGVYELLKRGCGLILVVDAEADPSMSFPSLLTLERYARIDLGVRIQLPWEEIARVTKRIGATAEHGVRATHGPHCAVGRIFYEDGCQGLIVYFKSSLTGDEKDYVLDYKKRYAAFPHETTADQFFTEEQFEAYRALGFHMVDGFFGTDEFSYLPAELGGFRDRQAAFAAVMQAAQVGA